MNENTNIIKGISIGRGRGIGIMLTTSTHHLMSGHKYNTFIDLTPAIGMRSKRRAVTQTCVMLEPWVAVATTCKTAKCNQFACVKSVTSCETVARNLAVKGKVRSAASVASFGDNLGTACGYGACVPHNSATKTRNKREGLRLPTPFYLFSRNHKGSKAMKHISNYIETHAWTWYALAAIWAVVLGGIN